MPPASRSTLGATLLALPWLLSPGAAAGQIAVVSSTVQEHTTAPGERYSGTILVSNPTRAVQIARVYQTDYRFEADGTSHYDPAGSLSRSNASWIRPAVTRLALPPGTTLPINYTIEVPSDSSLRGTYWSMLMVEGEVEPAAAPPSTANGGGIGLQPVIRYGIQVVSHLRPAGSTLVSFVNARTTAAGAHEQQLEFELHNTGSRAFRPDVRIEVYDETGALRTAARQTRGQLYPGCSLLQRFTLPGVAGGPHQALIIVDAGEDQVFGANYTIRP